MTLVTIAGAVLGTLVVGGALLLLLRTARRRRRAAEAAAPVVDLRPAHEIALEKLELLRRSPMLEAADRRPFTFALSEIAREYLGRRFGFGALDMTTSELEAALAGAALASAVRDEVGRWLAACDLVKFARVPASRDEAAAALEQAARFIEASRPAPPMTTQPPPPGSSETVGA